MNYRSVADLNTQILHSAYRLPFKPEVIVGIPRSGMLAANLLALHLNLPLTDLEGLLEGRMMGAGARMRRMDLSRILAEPRDILILDDSVLTGRQFARVKERLAAMTIPHRIRYAAVYMAPGSEEHVDFFFERVAMPRCFEWNLMHNADFLSKTCMDIDGVLCRDPLDHENDDGGAYGRFLEGTEPLYLPSRPVGWLVTSRLEKYRSATESWLARHGVEYQNLVMMDYPTIEARREARAYATSKAGVYEETKAWLFVESSATLSRRIAEITGKSVFCTDTREMIQPGFAAQTQREMRDFPGRVAAGLKRANRFGRRVASGLGLGVPPRSL